VTARVDEKGVIANTAIMFQSARKSKPGLQEIHMTIRRALVAVSLVLGACVGEPGSDPSSLQIWTKDATRVSGQFDRGDSVVRFESTSLDQRRATLHLEINDAVIDTTIDLQGTLHQDGHATVLGEDELATLLALRDAVQTDEPDLVRGTLQGKFLARHADWLADAPVDHELDVQDVDVADRMAPQTTEDDSIYNTCLVAGYWYTAYYDAGNNGQQWMWTRQANSGSCLGRCGAGCNWFDHDLMLDCFEHDTCLDHFGGSSLGDNANCGDEFNHAMSEYVVTYGAWCP
jgi:hypothetical protein